MNPIMIYNYLSFYLWIFF